MSELRGSGPGANAGHSLRARAGCGLALFILGMLILVPSGLCTSILLLSVLNEPLRDILGAVWMVLLIGGPFILVGGALVFVGLRWRRSAKQRNLHEHF